MNFRLGSIPVRVRGAFILTALFLGANYREPAVIAVWVAVLFVSVLLHELGHAVAGMAFGLSPVIDLHGMGGTTSWLANSDTARDRQRIGAIKSIVISVAGPFTGIAIGGAFYLALARGWEPGGGRIAAVAIVFAVQVNLIWGAINLVPMLPLDGGNVMRSALNGITGGRGDKAARAISIVIAAGALVYAISTKQIWIGLLSALFLFSNIQEYRRIDQVKRDVPLARAIEKANEHLQKQEGAEAIALLKPALVPGVSRELRELALRLYAYGLVLEGHWGELMPLLSAERDAIGREDLALHAKAARELGREEDARAIEALAVVPAAAPMANDFRA